MKTYPTPAVNDSDFGPTVPGQRSGEGSGSILPYLAKSLKVNPNAGGMSLAREMSIASKARKKGSAPANVPGPAAPPASPASAAPAVPAKPTTTPPTPGKPPRS